MCSCQSILVNDKCKIQSSLFFVVLNENFRKSRKILGSENLLPPDFGDAQINLWEVKSNR